MVCGAVPFTNVTRSGAVIAIECGWLVMLSAVVTSSTFVMSIMACGIVSGCERGHASIRLHQPSVSMFWRKTRITMPLHVIASIGMPRGRTRDQPDNIPKTDAERHRLLAVGPLCIGPFNRIINYLHFNLNHFESPRVQDPRLENKCSPSGDL
uniref:Uncharacterized protein n=1 Tax=Anopheles farauti TaxID=69004 RepID=A0A182QRA5_9DIPT